MSSNDGFAVELDRLVRRLRALDAVDDARRAFVVDLVLDVAGATGRPRADLAERVHDLPLPVLADVLRAVSHDRAQQGASAAADGLSVWAERLVQVRASLT